MKEQILELVLRRDHVSFVELSRDVPGFRGELAMFTPEFPNVILWPAVSEEGISNLSELLRDGQLRMKMTTPLLYAVDGRLPTLPLARGLKPYKSPRWLPVTFTTCPVPSRA